MSGSTSTAKGALRTASLVITLITIVTFATVGYSAYQAYLGVTSPGFRSGISQNVSVSGSSLVVSVSGSFRNAGLYPIDLSTFIGLSSAQPQNASSSRLQEIPVGSSRQFNISASIDPLSALPPSALAGAFYNGTDLSLTTGFSASLVPFLGLKVGIPTPLRLSPFAAGMRVSSAVLQGGQLSVALEFTNQEPIPYLFTATGVLIAPSGAVLDSPQVSGQASPGGNSLTLLFSSQSLAQGQYALTLHMVVRGHDLPITLRVEVA